MYSLTFIDPHGVPHPLRAEANRSLMQVAVDNNVPGILGDCGGCCSCATCHAQVDPAWQPHLPPMDDTEAAMLDGVVGRTADSRLCCQIPMTAALDGIVLRIPQEAL